MSNLSNSFPIWTVVHGLRELRKRTLIATRRQRVFERRCKMFHYSLLLSSVNELSVDSAMLFLRGVERVSSQGLGADVDS